MSLLNIRAQIKAILETVAGIGVVHDYERWAVDWEKILEFFKPANQEKINSWMVTRTATEERGETLGSNLINHSFLIRGIYSLDDAKASEKTFQDLIESIRTEFRENFNLNGSCESTYLNIEGEGKVGIQAALIEMRTFGSVLCHYCELQLGAQERVTY